MSKRKPRAGFTLLEMILALAIGMVLLGALYLSMNTQLELAQSGRDLVQEGNLARGILNRIASDILGNLGPHDAKLQEALAGSSAAQTDPSTQTEPGSESETPQETTDPAAGASGVVFNRGVWGTSNTLVLYVSKVPREILQGQNLQSQNPNNPEGISDLRRISYWLLDLDKGGLARQELTQVTGEGANTRPPDVDNPTAFLFAPEVQKIEFRYFDGLSWQTDWDGTRLREDNQTTVGPPCAIEITLTLRRTILVDGQPQSTPLGTYRHVVALPTGNGYGQVVP